MIFILGLIVIVMIFFFCGAFECFIVKTCSLCGNNSKTHGLCHLFTGILPLDFKVKLKDKKQIGVIHNYFYCDNCAEKFMEHI
jgi:hypothetical protein